MLRSAVLIGVIAMSVVACGGGGSSSVGASSSSGGGGNQLQITTSSLPPATVGAAYTATLTASGGTPPYTWTLASGSLPAGLTLPADGTGSWGTPTGSGSSTFTIEVTDSSGTGLATAVLQTVEVPNTQQVDVSGLSASFTQATRAGDTLVAWVQYSHDIPNIGTVSDTQDQQWTRVLGTIDPSPAGQGDEQIYVYVMQDSKSLAATDKVNFALGATTDNMGMLIQEIQGVPAASFIDAVGTLSTGQSGVNTIASGTLAAGSGMVFILANGVNTTAYSSAVPGYPSPDSPLVSGGQWNENIVDSQYLSNWSTATLSNPGNIVVSYQTPASATSDNFIVQAIAFATMAGSGNSTATKALSIAVGG